MTPAQKKRLLKLYEWLKQPQRKLAHKKFDFDKYNFGGVDIDTAKCGTVGCAAGELPAVFPKQWTWIAFDVRLKKNCTTSSEQDIARFFGLRSSEMFHLFYPRQQRDDIDPYYDTHKQLQPTATKRQVVANLHRFLIIKGILPKTGKK